MRQHCTGAARRDADEATCRGDAAHTPGGTEGDEADAASPGAAPGPG